MTERTAAPDVPLGPLVWLFLTAGLLGVVSVVVPHDPITRNAVVLGISAVALLLAALLAALRSRGVGTGEVGVLLAVATVLTSAAIWATGGPPNATSALYMWICLYAAYVLSSRMAIATAVGCAAAYVAVTAIDPPPYPPIAHLTTSAASLIGATLIVTVLRARLAATMQQLEQAASTDPLTGLANRRQFEESLERELARSHRDVRPVALVVCDLDHFKEVNDTHGHAAGDDVLRLVGDVLAEHSRTVDVAARLGGEEFALVLPDTDAAGGILVAERLRLELQRRSARSGPRVTVSLGVACSPASGGDASALLREADRALYTAKRLGRNCTVGAEVASPVIAA